MSPERRALVVSPTPSHPSDHGHRNRVRQTTSLLAAAGFAIDFLLYPMDDDWRTAIPPGLAQMQAAWGGKRGGTVTIAPPSRVLHVPPIGRDHLLDEWWDPALDVHLAFLCERRVYDVMLVNYVFLSRAFSHATPRCLRVLDAHDRLAGRRALFERHGASPEFFHLTEAEEARGLARADLVLAIKVSEAEAFRAAGSREVVTLPFFGAGSRRRRGRAGERGAIGPLRVGFFGADNAVNAVNLANFIRRLDAWRALFLPDLVLIVAGNVCRRVAPVPDCVVLLGRVENVASFYDAVDVVVAPLAFSTGLKIKVAEALARGMPIVATADAFDGFASEEPLHNLPDIEAVCGALIALAADRDRLPPLAAAARRAAVMARVAVAAGVAALRIALDAPAPDRRFAVDVAAAPPPRLVFDRADPLPRRPPPGSTASPLRRGRQLDASRLADPVRATPFAIVLAERSADPREIEARNALLKACAAACVGRRLAVLHAADLPRDKGARATLATLPAPNAIIGIALGAESRAFAAQLATRSGAAFFALGDPYPLSLESGSPPTIQDLGDHLHAISRWLRAPPVSPSAKAAEVPLRTAVG